MTHSNSVNAFPREQAAFERALASPKGIRHRFDTEAAARRFQSTLHHFRALDRKEAAKAFGDPTRLTSEWDVILCTVREDTEGHWWVYLEKLEFDPSVVEEL